MLLFLGATDGQRHINPSFQHSSIQELLLGCASTLPGFGKPALKPCFADEPSLWVSGQTKSGGMLMAVTGTVKGI
jgi:hypothetical protein